MDDDIDVNALLKRISEATDRIKLQVEEIDDYRFRIVAIDDYTDRARDALPAIGAYAAGKRQQNLAILIIQGLELIIKMQMGEPGLGLEDRLQSENPACVGLHDDSVALLQDELRSGVDRIAAHEGGDRGSAVHTAATLALASHMADGLEVPAHGAVH